MYFMDMDLGVPITEKGNYKVYQEKEKKNILEKTVFTTWFTDAMWRTRTRIFTG